MEKNDIVVDQELLLGFVEESEEMLSNAVNFFITLESEPDNKEAIGTIFRALHTIKGNSAFFNLLKTKSLAHIMEDLMSLVRDGIINFSSELADLMLMGIEYIRKVLKRVRENLPEVDNEDEYSDLAGRITALVKNSAKKDIKGLWRTVMKDMLNFKDRFYSEDEDMNALLGRVMVNLSEITCISENARNALAKNKNPVDSINEILSNNNDRVLDIKLSREVYNALLQLKKIATLETAGFVDEAISCYHAVIQDFGFTQELRDYVSDKLKGVKIQDSMLNAVSKDEKQEQNKTVRIKEENLDVFLNFIGELILVGETYEHIHKRLVSKNILNKEITDFKRNNEMFNNISFSLQKGVLDLRKVSINALFKRAPKLVRDVACAKNKDIKVVMHGDDLLIDKNILEMIEPAFVHILRNAADHGIEIQQIRQEKGKNPQGQIIITVSEDQENMSITIKDDGGGINKDKVLNKAVEKGLITAERALSLTDNEIYQFLFLPGFSTAEKITDISGRGVGLDVVKNNIEAIKGEIIIESKLDCGTEISVRFPKSVSLKLFQGFVVMAAGRKFVIPLTSVGESFQIQPENRMVLPDKKECIKRNDNVYSFIKLSDYLLDNIGGGFADENNKYMIGVTIIDKKRKFVLGLDDILGIQPVLMKDMHGLKVDSEAVVGGAILGDENIAVVLDPEKIISD